MANTLYVMSTDRAGNNVILYEVHDAHPNGEVFLRGYADPERRKAEGAEEVGDTAAIRDKIHEGYLVETTKAGNPKKTSD